MWRCTPSKRFVTLDVFNVEQIDGLTLTEEDTAEPVNEFDPLPYVGEHEILWGSHQET